MRLQNFIAISQQLLPLGVSNVRADKQKNKLVDVPPKTGSPIAPIHVPFDRAGGM